MDAADLVLEALGCVRASLKFSALSVLNAAQLKRPQTEPPGQVTQDAERSKATL